MTTTVDKKLVELGFDNKQFESGVSQSVGSLGSLKKSIENTAGSLSAFDKIGNAFNSANIVGNLQSAASGFTALGMIGFSVINNLTNSVINFGKKMADSLLVAPLRTGLQEYETQINAIQTIMANTAASGTTMDQIKNALGELNTYADKTIYSFTEMTRNIGTFTAAGVSLDTSVQAIKGIANLAAMSGSNSQQAATAMYQLSQALSSGTVKLMDWNSVVNAGMGGQVFQNALKETARVHGIAIDDMITKQGSFRETLQNGWLSSTILTETLSKFTGDLTTEQLKSMGYTDEQAAEILKLGILANDAATKVKTISQLMETSKEAMQSGWSKSWEIIIGDFEEAKLLMTEVSNILTGFIGASADSRNALLQGWKDLGGRTALIDALRNAFFGLLSIVAPIKEAFAELFPPITGKQLANISFWIRDLTAKFKLGIPESIKLKKAFRGLAAVFDIGEIALKTLAKALLPVLAPIKQFGLNILDAAAGFGDYLYNLRNTILLTDAFGNALDTVKGFIGTVKAKVVELGAIFGTFFANVKEYLSGLFSKIDFSGLDLFTKKIETRFGPLGAMADMLQKVLGGLFSFIKKIAPGIAQFANFIWNAISAMVSGIFDAMGEVNFTALFDLVNTGLLGALIVSVKNFVDSGSGVFSDVAGILNSVRTSIETWQQSIKAKTLLQIAIAIAILAGSIIALSMVDSGKLAGALTGMTVMFTELMASMSAMSGFTGKSLEFVKVSTLLISVSIALAIMSAAVVNLSRVKPEELRQGLIGIGILLVGISIFVNTLSQNTRAMAKGAVNLIFLAASLEILVDVVKRLGSIDVGQLQQGLIGVGVLLAEMGLFLQLINGTSSAKQSVGLIVIAASLLILATAVEKFGNLDPAKMTQGIQAVGILLAELALFSNVVGKLNLIPTAIAITIIGAAMLILAEAVDRLGSLDYDVLQKGLAAMAGALLIVTAALNLIPKDAVFSAVAIVAVSAALLMIASALTTLGDMSWEEIARGLAAMAGALILLAAGMYVMNGSLGGAAALIVSSAALLILASALSKLGEMSVEEIVRSLLAIAGVFAILGIAGLLLTPVIPTLMSLAGSILLLGLAAAAIGVGIFLLSAGLSGLAAGIVALGGAIVTFVTMAVGMIPILVVRIVEALTLLLTAIAAAAPAIGAALTAILLTLIQVIADVTPALLVAFGQLLLNLIAVIVTAVPPLIDAVFVLIGAFLSALASNLPAIIQAGFDIILAFLNGIANNIAAVVQAAIDIVIQFVDGIASKIPDVIDSAFNLIISFVDGLTQGIEDNMPVLMESIANLADAIINGLTDGLFGGIGEVIDAMTAVGSAALEAIKAALGIKSPSKEMAKVGSFAGAGLVKGLNSYGTKVEESASGLGVKAIDSIQSALDSVNNHLSDNIDTDITIRPVIDLDEVLNGEKQINKILGTNKFQLPVSGSKLPVIAIQNGSSAQEEGTSTQKTAQEISFVQNNYSPKALSRYDIYRQTKNQLGLLKDLVGA